MTTSDNRAANDKVAEPWREWARRILTARGLPPELIDAGGAVVMATILAEMRETLTLVDRLEACRTSCDAADAAACIGVEGLDSAATGRCACRCHTGQMRVAVMVARKTLLELEAEIEKDVAP